MSRPLPRGETIPRGRCKVCRVSVRLSTDGRVVSHPRPATEADPPDALLADCGGGGYFPAATS